MSHDMFLQIVALNTYTDPFMKLKTADQRKIPEKLLGITQLSQRALALKEIMDETKEQLRDAEATIKATTEANSRIEQAIERAKSDAELWQAAHDRNVNELMAKANVLNEVDIDFEIAIFDQLEEWFNQNKEITNRCSFTLQKREDLTREISRIQKDIARYESESTRTDNGEIVELEAQIQRYLTESESDITPQIKRLESEASRRREEAERKIVAAERLAAHMSELQEQLDNPDAHTCTTCGQGLGKAIIV